MMYHHFNLLSHVYARGTVLLHLTFDSSKHTTTLNLFDMKKVNLKKLFFTILSCLALAVITTSCTKKGTTPDNLVDNSPHLVDARFVGKWMWTKGSDGAYYDNDGVYHGAAY